MVTVSVKTPKVPTTVKTVSAKAASGVVPVAAPGNTAPIVQSVPIKGAQVDAVALDALKAKVAELEFKISSVETKVLHGLFVDLQEDGSIRLNIEDADRESLRNWVWQFGYEESLVDADNSTLRGLLTTDRDSPSFAGFDIKRAGMAPVEGPPQVTPSKGRKSKKANPEPEVVEEQEEELPPCEVPEEAIAPALDEEDSAVLADDEEVIELTEEAIQKMNWLALTEVCDQIELSYSDIIPPSPKVLRSRLLDALRASQDDTFAAGEKVIVTAEGKKYYGTVVEYDSDGDVMVQWDDDGDIVPVSPEMITRV